MANNELSGPVLTLEILNFLVKNIKNNHYTYRFLLAPETIGSIAYLSRFKNHLKKKLYVVLIFLVLVMKNFTAIFLAPITTIFLI